MYFSRLSKQKTKRESEKKPAKKPLENNNSFLYKLWTLVNDEAISCIHWSQDGEKIVIENPTKFTAKVLVSSDKQLFKTKNISSFIRQLNLYGFRRVKDNCGKIPLIFKHESFKKGRPDLLGIVQYYTIVFLLESLECGGVSSNYLIEGLLIQTFCHFVEKSRILGLQR